MVWQGAAVVVVDFREGRERDGGLDEQRFLVARCGGSVGGALVAFAVDSEILLHQPSPDDRAVGDPRTERPSFIAGIFDVFGNPVALVDLDALLSTGLKGD